MEAANLAPDEYELEGLRRRYQWSDAKGRIALLKEFAENAELPFELARLAVQDPEPEIRCWIASITKLNYSEIEEINNRWVYKSPERNLAVRLMADPDPFVRASLYANRRVWVADLLYSCNPRVPWLEWWKGTSQIERLGLLRGHGWELWIEGVFDLNMTTSALL